MRKAEPILHPVLFFVLPAAIAVVGCTGDWQVGSGPPPVDAEGQQTETASLPTPIPLELTLHGVTSFSSELSNDSDMEVWDLGSYSGGERLIVDVTGEGDLSLGLFNEGEQVLFINHNRYGSRDPYGALTLQEDVDSLYLAISGDPLEDSAGRYWVRITHSEESIAEDVSTQHVVLNFNGATAVSVGNLPPIDVPGFRAADLDPSWAPLTEDIKDLVLEHMQSIYEGLDVRLYLDTDPELPQDVQLTWVHFGGEDTRNVGLADRVDYGNQYTEEKAVIYTQNFSKYVASGYDHQELAQGFANVASHELGHLLGLNHSDDPADIMNVSPTVAALMAPQYFVETAALDSTVFKAGYQDGAERIFASVGGDWYQVLFARADHVSYYDAYAHALPAGELDKGSMLDPSARLSSAQHPNCSKKHSHP